MNVRRCFLVIITAFLIFVISAVIFDSPALLAAAFSVGICIGIRFFLFLSQLKTVAASVVISRKPEKLLIRQGGVIPVTTHLVVDIPEGFSVSIQEILPPGVIAHPEHVEKTFSSHGPQEEDLTYQLTMVMHGDIRIPGFLLRVQDSFFSLELQVTKPQFAGSVIHVQPNPFFDKRTYHAQIGKKELNLFRDRQGQTIRSYRKYFQSDDYRIIDWKLSAKSRTLMVREYMGLQDDPPLIIVDLPDRDQIVGLETFDGMIRSITGVIERFFLEGNRLSLIIISGPNLIKDFFGQQDFQEVMNIIRIWFHPAFRRNYMYRTMSRSDVRETIAHIQRSVGQESEPLYSEYLSRLDEIYHHTLIESSSNLFSAQVARMFSSFGIHEIILYSLCEGDLSYISEISRQARYGRQKFCIRTPKERDIILKNPRNRRLKSEMIEGLI